MRSPLTMRAPAKINLFLHVNSVRADGYHLLDSLVTFSDQLRDVLTFSEAPDFSLTFSGWKPFADALAGEDPSKNLVMRAAKAYAAQTGIEGAAIHLEKNIPMGAGLGGGSSDAATTIKGLEQFFEKPLDHDIREKILVGLGADVPVCYRAASCGMQGIGDILKDVPALPDLPLLLIWPGAHVSTKDVFAKREKTMRNDFVIYPDNFGDLSSFIGFLHTTGNDLADAAESLCPVIRQAHQWLATQNGCKLVRMSGSGSSVFGVFESATARDAALERCLAAHPEWFVHAA